MPRYAIAVAGAAALALSLGSASADSPRAAPGQVVVGVVHAGPDNGCGANNMTLVQSSSATVPFTVPGPGVLTSWSTYANAQPAPGRARLVAFVPDQVGGQFNLVGKSAPADVTPSSVNTFGTRVPVPAGTVLGLHVSKSDMYCFYNGPELVAGDVFEFSLLFNPDTNTVMQTVEPLANAQVSVSAVWEPDIDADGYGDVTQDVCPQSHLSQVACPAPETKVKRKPKRVTTNRTVRLKLKSSADATFTCAVDGRKVKTCASPFRKSFKYGKHVIVVTAVSAAGIPDPTPVKVKFRVVRPRERSA